MGLAELFSAGVKIAQRTWQSKRLKAELWFHGGSVKSSPCSAERCSQRANPRVSESKQKPSHSRSYIRVRLTHRRQYFNLLVELRARPR